MKSIKITSLIKQNSQADVLNVPFVKYCPLSNNIPDWLKLTAEGRLRRLMKYHKVPTTCQRFVEGFVLKTDFVRETV